jgi:hypothetical protein
VEVGLSVSGTRSFSCMACSPGCQGMASVTAKDILCGFRVVGYEN